MKIRIVAICGIITTFIFCELWFHARHAKFDDDDGDRLFLVSIDADADWLARHRIECEWEGKKASLPAVFRLPPKSEYLKVGASFDRIKIGNSELRIAVDPPEPLRYENRPGFGFFEWVNRSGR